MADYRENVVSSVLLNMLQKDTSSEYLSEVLPACMEHNVFSLKNTDGLPDVVAKINSDLNTAKKRMQGLLVLQHVVEQCTAQVFSSNFHTWLNLLLQVLQGHAPAKQQQVALQILSAMIQKVTAFPELSRDMGSSKVRTVLPVLLSLTSDHISEAVVSCMCSCALHFPGPTSFFKDKIETFLVLELDSASPSQAHVRCYALLARCGTGSQRDKHREAWTTLYEKILQALKSLLFTLYEGMESGEDQGEDAIFQSKLPDVQPARTACLVRRFTTLCACLTALLREPFPASVPLHVDEILQLICRTLAVQVDMLVKKGSTDHLLLLTYLPLMYCSAFTLLSSLIVCGKRLLLPSGPMVMSLCVQCLTSTALIKGSQATTLSFRKVRQCVYQTLDTWMQVTGSSCLPYSTAPNAGLKDGPLSHLLAEIFSDIAPQQPEALQLGKSTTQQKTEAEPPAKKKRRKNRVHLELSVNTQLFTPDCQDVVCAALKVLQQVLANVAIFMKEDMLREVKVRVCDLVMEAQQRVRPPYTWPRCRQALYATLKAAVSTPTPDPLTLPHALRLFQRGALDLQFTVAVTCRQAVSVCRSLIHPQVPCLLGPVVTPAHPPSSSLTRAALTPAFTHSGNTTTTTLTAGSKRSMDGRVVKSHSPTAAAPETAARCAVDDTGSSRTTAETDHNECGNNNNNNAVARRGSVSSESSSRSLDGSPMSPPASPPPARSLKRGAKESGSQMDVSSEDSDQGPSPAEEEEDAGASVGGGAGAGGGGGGGVGERPDKSGVTETGVEMNAEVSAMLSSFVPCEADPEEDASDSD